MSATTKCPVCDDTGWVCENHPQRPFAMFSARVDACECGAGMPCQICAPADGSLALPRRGGFDPRLDMRGKGKR
jgi:hypothetical protein